MTASTHSLLVDLADRRVEVYSHPEPAGYTFTSMVEAEESLTVGALEHLTLTVDEIFG